jgi:hypothetical protein
MKAASGAWISVDKKDLSRKAAEAQRRQEKIEEKMKAFFHSPLHFLLCASAALRESFFFPVRT